MFCRDLINEKCTSHKNGNLVVVLARHGPRVLSKLLHNWIQIGHKMKALSLRSEELKIGGHEVMRSVETCNCDVSKERQKLSLIEELPAAADLERVGWTGQVQVARCLHLSL